MSAVVTFTEWEVHAYTAGISIQQIMHKTHIPTTECKHSRNLAAASYREWGSTNVHRDFTWRESSRDGGSVLPCFYPEGFQLDLGLDAVTES